MHLIIWAFLKTFHGFLPEGRCFFSVEEKKWKLSNYTVVLKCESSGDAIFHNSFMGAVARVPGDKFAAIEKFIGKEIREEDFQIESLRDLCQNGFFFPCNMDEQKFVVDVLTKEIKDAGFNMILLPHEDCNFRCEYCYETHERGKMESDVILGLKALAAEKAKEGRNVSVSWFGGEPLLAKDIIYDLSDSFICSCDKYGVSYSSSITTNGYFLTREVVANLLKRQVKRFQVTLDGPEAFHDKTRKLAGGGETYKTIIYNLEEMCKSDLDFYVTIRVNYNNESAVIMEDFFSNIAETFAKDSRFGLVFMPVGKLGGPNDGNLNVCSAAQRLVTETGLYKTYAKVGNIDKLVKERLQSHGQVCYAGLESSIVVGVNGTIYKCTVAFDDPLNHVGKLAKDGSMIIDRRRWDLWVANNAIDYSECASCPLNPSCQGKSCPKKSIKAKKAVCPLTTEEYKSKLALVAAIHHDGTLL